MSTFRRQQDAAQRFLEEAEVPKDFKVLASKAVPNQDNELAVNVGITVLSDTLGFACSDDLTMVRNESNTGWKPHAETWQGSDMLSELKRELPGEEMGEALRAIQEAVLTELRDNPVSVQPRVEVLRFSLNEAEALARDAHVRITVPGRGQWKGTCTVVRSSYTKRWCALSEAPEGWVSSALLEALHAEFNSKEQSCILEAVASKASTRAAETRAREDAVSRLRSPLAESTVKLSREEMLAAGSILGHKPAGRPRNFSKHRLGDYGADNEHVKSLTAKGLLKVRGKAVTPVQDRMRRAVIETYPRFKNDREVSGAVHSVTGDLLGIEDIQGWEQDPVLKWAHAKLRKGEQLSSKEYNAYWDARDRAVASQKGKN